MILRAFYLTITPLLVLLALVAPAPARPALSPQEEAFFESRVRPLLAKRCLRCHSAKKKKTRGGLDLSTRAGWKTGGDTGPAIKPGDPDASLLIRAIRQVDEDLQMPPRGKLRASDIAILEKWVRMGAPDPRIGKSTARKGNIDIEAGKKFWAFRPVVPVHPPRVQNNRWPLNAVDRFLLAAMEQRQVQPVRLANRMTLLRRVSYDLTGLPPSREELQRFDKDDSPDAYTRLVDRLLASPHFGEKWGRHWLDLARYADSNGSSFNPPFREAWRYRNWVINSLNADMPYDHFVTCQIAGDLMPARTIAERDRNVIATGYLMFGSKVLGLFDKPTLHLDVVDEQIDTISKGLLGLTVSCARCHDHKFDPIPQRDYYALAGIFSSTRTLAGRLDEPKADENDWSRRGLGPQGEQKLRAFTEQERYAWVKAGRKVYEARTRIEHLQQQLHQTGSVRDGVKQQAKKWQEELSEARKLEKFWKGMLARIEAKLPPLAMAPRDIDSPRDEHVRIRGVAASPGALVPRGFLQVASFPGQPTVNPEQSGRLQLAQWIASPRNPLTARVAVNRIWAHLFGEGIVRTVDNLGVRGERPSHPELLDYLAHRLVQRGWRLKPLIRELVISRAYRLAAIHDKQNDTRDPENRLFWKHNRRRLSPEEMRDSLLEASAQLDRSQGTTLIAHLPLKDLGGNEAPHLATLRDHRRTIYQPVIRNLMSDILEVFDFTNPNVVVGKRARTAVAPQALYLLNSPLVQNLARQIAKHVARETSRREPDELVRLAFLRIVRRHPTAEEHRLLVHYLRKQYEGPGTLTNHDIMKLCHVIMASTRFQFLD